MKDIKFIFWILSIRIKARRVIKKLKKTPYIKDHILIGCGMQAISHDKYYIDHFKIGSMSILSKRYGFNDGKPRYVEHGGAIIIENRDRLIELIKTKLWL